MIHHVFVRILVNSLLLCSLSAAAEENAPPQQDRVLPPESGPLLKRAFGRARDVLTLKNAFINRDHVNAVICEAASPDACFELRLEDPLRGCAGGDRAGPWCVRFTAGRPEPSLITTLYSALSVDAEHDVWKLLKASEEEPMAPALAEEPMTPDLADLGGDLGGIIDRYSQVLARHWPWMLASVSLTLLLGLLWQMKPSWHTWVTPRRSLWISRGVFIVFVGVGLLLVAWQASLVDDAYISFRYARNWVEGHGLVFNYGERVEGYTNFLWTALIALGMLATSLEAPTIAVLLGLACFVANLWVVYRIGRVLASQHGPRVYVPAAAMLLAIQVVFTSFGTTGMETMLASLFVDLGVLFLVSRRDARGDALSGAMFILGTFTRPDFCLFFISGGVAVLSRPQVTKDRIKALIVYGSPMIAYLIYLGWKLCYYGSILPNTYYAKSVDQWYLSQGLIYATSFFLGSHFWIILIFFAAWLFARKPGQQSSVFKVFSVSAFVTYGLYVLKIGGDFMYGRFLVPLMPILLLGAEDFIYRINRERSGNGLVTRLRRSVLPTCLLAITAHGSQFIENQQVEWNLAYESSFYPINLLKPECCYNSPGNELKSVFVDRGIFPVVGSGVIGMLGYHSRLPRIVDFFGLTDAGVATSRIIVRGRPGHEKQATRQYLRQQGVHFALVPSEAPDYQNHRRLTALEIEFDGRVFSRWRIVRYENDLMRRIKKEAPEVHFVDFENYLDEYISTLDQKTRHAVARDLLWFKDYYFANNEDPERLSRLEAYLQPGGE